MYAYAFDKLSAAMIGVLTRPFDEEADNHLLLESIAKQQASASSPVATAAFLLLVDPQYPQPSAKWRRRFAEARDGLRFAKTFFAVVTPETSLKGVLTAVNWMRPLKPNFEAESFSTFDEAVRWATERRGASPKPLQLLMTEVQEKLNSGPEGVSSVKFKTAHPPTAKSASHK